MGVSNPATVGVVGGGILGLATAREMTLRYPGVLVTVFEKEDRLAAHQTGRNSGVVHAGVYYKPGSLKAVLCRRGAGLLREYAQEHNIRYAELGKLIVAADESELDRLHDIEMRAIANGVPGIRRTTRARFTLAPTLAFSPVAQALPIGQRSARTQVNRDSFQTSQ